MKTLRLPLAVGLLAGPVAVWAGCGGASGTELTSPAEDGGAGGAATGSSSSASQDGGVTPNEDAGPSGIVVADGGQDPSDAGPGGSTTQLPCGSATCSIPGQSCCVQQLQGGGSSLGYVCVVGLACPAPDGGNNGDVTALGCSSAANCAASEFCCVSSTNGKTSSKCQAAPCTKQQGGGNVAQLCAKNAADAGCAQGVTCSSQNIDDWGLPSTYATCGGVGN